MAQRLEISAVGSKRQLMARRERHAERRGETKSGEKAPVRPAWQSRQTHALRLHRRCGPERKRPETLFQILAWSREEGGHTEAARRCSA